MQAVERPRADGGIDPLSQIDGHTRHGCGDGAAPGFTVIAMDMTAQQPGDLRMTRDQRFEFCCLVRMPVAPDIMRWDIEGWMMNEQDRGSVRLAAQSFLQPPAPTFTEDPFSFAVHNRVERNQAHGKRVDRVMEKIARRGQRGEMFESIAQFTPLVAVAGNDEQGRAQVVQDFAQVSIGPAIAPMDTVARVDDDIDILLIDIGDTLPQVERPIDSGWLC